MESPVTTRGFGISSLVSHEIVRELAAAAADAGYAMFWVNDLPGASGLASLGVAAGEAPGIELGVGVLAVDRWRPSTVAEAIQRSSIDPARLTIGIGAGQMTVGAVAAMQEACTGLLQLGVRRVVVGSLGPRMTRLGGEKADGVLLNWVSPTAAAVLAGVAHDAGSRSARTTWVAAYTRVAAQPEAVSRLDAECDAYEGYPAYARHFERFGIRARDTSILGGPSEVDSWLAGFTGDVDHVVARAIAAEETVGAYRAVLLAAAPRHEARNV